MRIFILILFVVVSVSLFGQDLPRNPIPGKCYVRCFDYQERVEWQERDCDSLKWRKPGETFEIKGEEAVNFLKKKIKFKNIKRNWFFLGMI